MEQKPYSFAVSKPVTVTNLLSGEKLYFCNALSLEENIVSAIICIKKQTGDLVMQERRDAIKVKYKIASSVSSITGREFAYCDELSLHAKFSS